jgi:spore coat polysaccharide biosynthesis protein SpsF
MIVAIIQARLGSTRTPGKTMKLIADKPLLEYSVERAKQARYVDKVIVATTTSDKDNLISEWCKEKGIASFRGSEDDVLDRYFQTASYFKADIIVRITSDCPFVDPQIIDLLILTLKVFGADYASNRIKKRTWPHGLDTEIFTYEALNNAWKDAREEREREHVTPYIIGHPELFKLIEVPLEEDLSRYRLTVDYPEDLEFTRIIVEKYNANKMNWREIIDFLKKYPELVEINASRLDSRL